MKSIQLAILLTVIMPVYQLKSNTASIDQDDANSQIELIISEKKETPADLLAASLNTSEEITSELKDDLPEQNALMTIFIHGTLHPPQMSLSNIFAIMKDKIDNTLYERAAFYLRKDPRYFQGQAMQELGLKHINISPFATPSTARTVAQLYDVQLTHLEKKHRQHLYYTFGWHGLLSDSRRYEESENLYKTIALEIKSLSSRGIYPFIQIIAYSHGGNVALYLPRARDNNQHLGYKPFTVDQLITIATPIQTLTDYLAADPLFKEIVHLYSTEDLVQIADFASSGGAFPQHHFTERKNFSIPKKLKQVRIRLTKKVKQSKDLSETNPYLVLEHEKTKLVHKDPKHTEMWSFGWAAYWYRENFPLNPLPVMCLIPTILHSLEHAPLDHSHISFDYAPGKDGVLIKSIEKKGFKKAYPFLTAEVQNKLWDIANSYRPTNFSIKTQEALVANALEKARRDLIATKKYRTPHNKALAQYMKQIDSGYFNDVNEFKSSQSTLIAQMKN